MNRPGFQRESKEMNPLWEDYTMLMVAAANGMINEVRYEVERNEVDIDEKGGWNNTTALMLAAQRNELEVVRYLLDKEAKVDLTNDQENTALIIAAEEGNLKVVQLLAEYGANVGMKNEYGHTALIIATERGHLSVVEWIANFKPKYQVEDQLLARNKYDKTALIVACEFGQCHIVNWLVNVMNCDVNLGTKRGISPLMYACKSGSKEKSSLLAGAANHPLGYAAVDDLLLQVPADDFDGASGGGGGGGGGGESSQMVPVDEVIVEILLKKGARVNQSSSDTWDTALLWASIAGNINVVEKLLNARAHVNHKNKKGYTALMKAAEMGKEAVVNCLINHGARQFDAMNDEEHHDGKMDAMKIAWLHGHVKIATTYFMLPLDAEYGLLSRPVTDIFPNDLELDEIAKRYANPEYYESLKALVTLAACYDFHFDLFVKLIPRFKTPNTVLNKQIVTFYRTMYRQSHQYDVDMVPKFVQLAAAFSRAAESHPLEKIDLKERVSALCRMLTECLNSDCMDDEKNVQAILCASVNKWNDRVYSEDLVEKAQAFLKGPLETCIRSQVTALFSTGHVSTYVNNLFWGFLRQHRGGDHRPVSFSPEVLASRHKRWLCCVNKLPVFENYRFFKHSEAIRKFQSRFLYLRFSPAAMFFAEGLSKIANLILVSLVALNVRNSHGETQWGPDSEHVFSAEEIMLLVLNISMAIYEYGQVCERTTAILPELKGVAAYVSDLWNCLDDAGLILIFVYAILAYSGVSHTYSDSAVAALSTSTIFFSIGLLRYFCVFEPVGKLVIMVFAMISELGSFAVVYTIFVFGFCVCLYCLLTEAEAFTSFSATILTLISASISNYDSTFETMVGGGFKSVAIVVQVIYILLTSVVLLNLIIARMSSIFNAIDDESFQEWQFSKALIVQQFMLVEERHPFCMLPPPFNLIALPLAPFHIFFLHHGAKVQERRQAHAIQLQNGHKPKSCLSRFCCRCCSTCCGCRKKGEEYEDVHNKSDKDKDKDDHHSGWLSHKERITMTSLCGTLSDTMVGVVMSFIAPLIEQILYFVSMMSDILTNLSDHRNLFTLLSTPELLELIIVTAAFPVWYVLFVIALLWSVLLGGEHTKVVLVPSDDGIHFVIEYEQKTRFEKPHKLASDVDFITINLIRCEELVECKEDSNPIVKFRLGMMEAVSGSPIYAGVRPQWNNCTVSFPLRPLNLLEDKLTIEVVDKDWLTGAEVVLGHIAKPIEIKNWLGNLCFEGPVELANGRGKVLLDVKVEFPSFMCRYPESNIPATRSYALFKAQMTDKSHRKTMDINLVEGASRDNPSLSRKSQIEDDEVKLREMDLYEAIREEPLFLQEDKDRIFSHALRPKVQKSQLAFFINESKDNAKKSGTKLIRELEAKIKTLKRETAEFEEEQRVLELKVIEQQKELEEARLQAEKIAEENARASQLCQRELEQLNSLKHKKRALRKKINRNSQEISQLRSFGSTASSMQSLTETATVISTDMDTASVLGSEAVAPPKTMTENDDDAAVNGEPTSISEMVGVPRMISFGTLSSVAAPSPRQSTPTTRRGTVAAFSGKTLGLISGTAGGLLSGARDAAAFVSGGGGAGAGAGAGTTGTERSATPNRQVTFKEN